MKEFNKVTKGIIEDIRKSRLEPAELILLDIYSKLKFCDGRYMLGGRCYFYYNEFEKEMWFYDGIEINFIIEHDLMFENDICVFLMDKTKKFNLFPDLDIKEFL